MSESQDKHSQHTRSQEEERFLNTLNETLGVSEKSIDAATQGRLRAVRREAMLSSGSSTILQSKPQQPRPAWWMPVGSLAVVATVAVVAVSLWSLPPGQVLDEEISAAEDIALLSDFELSDSETLEFYEDLDFYLWLEDEQKAG